MMQTNPKGIPILYVSSVAGIGGAELSLVELVAHLDQRRFPSFFYVSSKGPLSQRFREMDVQVYYGSFPFFRRRNPFEYLFVLLRLVYVIRSNNIRIMQINCDRAVPLGVTACRLAGISCICYIHDFLRAWYLPSYVKHLNRARYIVADSISVSQKCIGTGMRQDLIRVIYESVECERFRDVTVEQGKQMRNELGYSDQELVVGIVGKFIKWKGHETLFRSIHLALSQLPNLRLIVVGDTELTGFDDYELVLRNLSIELGIENQVKFIGWRNDIPMVMKSLDILAMPSDNEPFGRSAAEALAAGVPVIATRAGGLLEIVQDGVTGILVSPGNVEELAKAIVELGLNHDKRIMMGQRGPESVLKFDVKHHISEFVNLYRQCVGEEIGN